jgi:Uma2 family endonuclease
MTAVELEPIRPQRSRRFPINKDAFYRMMEAGEFNGKRVELIGGEIIEMPAQSNWHGWAVKAATTHLDAVYGPNFWVRVQMSLDLSPLSVPDPDVAVIRGRYLDLAQRTNPTTALLVVEVSETTLADDRRSKGSLYAASGIPEYWIVNMVQRVVEVYRNPQVDSEEEFGHRYSSMTTLDDGQVVEVPGMPGKGIKVSDLLPPLAP